MRHRKRWLKLKSGVSLKTTAISTNISVRSPRLRLTNYASLATDNSSTNPLRTISCHLTTIRVTDSRFPVGSINPEVRQMVERSLIKNDDLSKRVDAYSAFFPCNIHKADNESLDWQRIWKMAIVASVILSSIYFEMQTTTISQKRALVSRYLL